MVTIDLAVLHQASQFSDWRLYPSELSRCCGLEAISKVSGDIKMDGSRHWKGFEEFSPELKVFTELFLSICTKHQDGSSFAVAFGTVDGQRLRIRVQSLGGFYAGRFIVSQPLDLDAISGVTKEVRDLVMSTRLNASGGLVLMAGNAGTGKSVFAAAAMRHRLKEFGGHLVVAGDPPEQPVGDDGLSMVGLNGYVDTVDICEIGYTKGLSMILRSYPAGKRPSLLFNEIRSDSNAFDLVNCALNGQVIFATIHASSADACVDRLISWCVRGGGDIALVRNMLAQSLFGVTVHRIDHGSFKIFPFMCSEETRQKIRDGYALPFKATALTKFG